MNGLNGQRAAEEYEEALKIAKDCLDWVENKIVSNNGASQMKT